MSYQALARKWRPRQFEEVLGQQHVVAALANALNGERVHHAYLFTGTRGVGKTTLARIFARALNCETGVSATPCGECAACVGVDNGNFIDLLEVDAASRTRVDDTRELLDNVQYAPTQGRFKIYLIDEVHMLSTHSFNALLKTLEEPPAHVKFLLATTDPQKLPATILSRCIQFNLKAMDVDQLDQQLDKILVAEQIAADSEARRILARAADGSVRDALSLLDQAVAFGNGEVRSDQVRSMLGMIDDRFVGELLDAVQARDGAAVLGTIASMAERSVDYGAALNDILGRLHYAALFQVSPEAVEARGIDAGTVSALAEGADPELLQLLYQMALIGKRDFSLAPDPRTGFEMAMLRLAAFQPAGTKSQAQTISSHARSESGRHDSAQGHGPRSAGAIEQNEQSASPVDQIRRQQSGSFPAESTKGQTAAAPASSPPERTPGSNPVLPAKAQSGRSGDRREQTPPDYSPDSAAPAAAGDRQNAESTRSQLDDAALQSLASREGWADFVEQSTLTGMVRELVMNMAPVSLDDYNLRVSLDQNARHLLNETRQARIEQQLSSQLGADLHLVVDVTELDSNQIATPSQRKQKIAEQRQQAAEQAFEQDPNVQALVDLFDAEVIPDSVRPGST